MIDCGPDGCPDCHGELYETVSVIIPYRESDEWRARSRHYVTVALALTFGLDGSEPEVIQADDPHESFNRGRAINAGVEQSSGDVLVFADADLWIPPQALRYALTVVNEYGMVVPFDNLIGLGPEATEMVYAGADPSQVWAAGHVELDWRRRSVGGCNVLRRDVFETVGGFDERFAGWGSEDSAFEAAVSTLGGPVGWVPARAVHLYHPVDKTRGTVLTDNNAMLAEEYQLAWGDVEAMRALTQREVVA